MNKEKIKEENINLKKLHLNVTQQEIDRLTENAKKLINPNNKDDMKEREESIFKLASIYALKNESDNLQKLIPLLKNHIVSLSKSRASKLVQDLLNLILETDTEKQPAIELCYECIQWAEQAKSNFLAHSLKVRLAELYYDVGEYEKCLPLVNTALNDMKIYDNKRQMVEIMLLESKLYYAMGNIVKSKASLTSARINATSIYVTPKLQADMDMQSATIHAKERDFITAYSYFYEAYDLYRSSECPKTTKALKYMLLCKIMLNKPEDVHNILNNKVAKQFIDESLRAVEKIALAFKAGSVKALCDNIDQYENYLSNDIIIKDHLDDLTENLIEKSILSVIKPYSSIGLDYLSEKLDIEKTRLVIKLSSMILDGIFNGILDQGCEVLEIKPKIQDYPLLENSLNLVKSLDELVESISLKEKAFTPV